MEPYDPTKACPDCGLTFDSSDRICNYCEYGKPEEKTEPEKSTKSEIGDSFKALGFFLILGLLVNLRGPGKFKRLRFEFLREKLFY